MTEVALEVCLIHWDTDEYRQELQLRNEVLSAFRDQELIGTLILSARDGHLKMRQVAVAEYARGSHVGTRMVHFAEHLACEMGCRRIELHARQSAVEFYQRNGYGCIGEKFEEIGITHFNMGKNLACP